jgi:putative transcriptional regulator
MNGTRQIASGLLLLLVCFSKIADAGARLLIATDGQASSTFAESVVLAIDHGNHGTVGVILNQPSAVEPGHFSANGLEQLGQLELPVMRGGPVNPEMLVFLYRSTDRPPPDSLPVVGDLYLSFSANRLRSVLADEELRTSLRLFHGYSGWHAGQLESELERNGWHTIEATATQVVDLVYADDPDWKMWQELIRPFRGLWTDNRPPLQPLLVSNLHSDQLPE